MVSFYGDWPAKYPGNKKELLLLIDYPGYFSREIIF